MPKGGYRRKRATLAERFERLSIPEPNTGCWLWLGHVAKNGYGRMTVGHDLDEGAKTSSAHKVSYEYFVGPVPEGKILDHICRIRCCVNPEHLEPVTHQINVRRGMLSETNKLRFSRQTHCKKGHLLSGENLRLTKIGFRLCRICQSAFKKSWRNKQRG